MIRQRKYREILERVIVLHLFFLRRVDTFVLYMYIRFKQVATFTKTIHLIFRASLKVWYIIESYANETEHTNKVLCEGFLTETRTNACNQTHFFRERG